MTAPTNGTQFNDGEYVAAETVAEGGIGDWLIDLQAEYYNDNPAAPCEPVDPTAIEALAWWAVPVEAMAAD